MMFQFVACVVKSKGVRLVVIAIGPKAMEDEYRKVLEAIAGEELFFVQDYDELKEMVTSITAFICRKYYLKRHSQLVYMRIRYHFLADLHITLHHKSRAEKRIL